MAEKMPLASKKRALLLGAGFIEHDLMQRQREAARRED